jgi:hypothetical protein
MEKASTFIILYPLVKCHKPSRMYAPARIGTAWELVAMVLVLGGESIESIADNFIKTPDGGATRKCNMFDD